MKNPIGVFDSGYGGLTILTKFQEILGDYDYYYLGDNARAPYGPKSYDIVYKYTKECVYHLFEKGCQLVILACNTASAKALKTIQQEDLPRDYPDRRVLGVIRPTVELLDEMSQTKHIGILATIGTVQSESYNIELRKLHPHIVSSSLACPIWVELVENNELDTKRAHYYVEKYIREILSADETIDTLVLACTHYPLLLPLIRKYVGKDIQILSQGKYVAESLKDYLNRHPEIENLCSKGGKTKYYTTEDATKFSKAATGFLGREINAEQLIF